MSVRLSARNSSAPTGRIFMKFGMWLFFRSLFHLNLARITGALHECLCIFTMRHRWFRLGKRNILDNISRENQNEFYIQYTLSKIMPFIVMWKNTVQPDRPQMSVKFNAKEVWFAWRIPEKNTNTYWFFFFAVALRPNAGHGLLILEVSRSHTTTHHSR